MWRITPEALVLVAVAYLLVTSGLKGYFMLPIPANGSTTSIEEFLWRLRAGRKVF
jgi:hypothetical protein